MDLQTLYDTPSWEWPEDADKLILAALRNDRVDAADRLMATAMAGDSVVVNDELVDGLLSILGNDDAPDDLRGRAAISLGPALEYADLDWLGDGEGFDDPEAVPISEHAFLKILKTLHTLYTDADTPKYVRRRVLEAAVRAPQEWHEKAIREAYAVDDEDWRLTAVFCMQFIRGFDDCIVESLSSRNADIHYEAVCAAGNWGVDAAWEHVTGLLTSTKTDKRLLLAAIDATAGIRPTEAPPILYDLTNSADEDIVEAVHEALALTGGGWEEGAGRR